MEAKKDKEIYDSHGVRAVRRAVEILCRLANDGESSITKLAHDTGLHKSTVYRLLTTLEQDAMVRQDPITGQYKLGWKVMELGASVIRGVELRTCAHPHLERLARKTNATVHLAILDQGSVLYIDKIEVEGSFKLYSQIGRRAPLHCTALGKVLVAFLPPAEQSRLIGEKELKRYTRRTITEPAKVLKHLKTVAEQGYAVDDSEHEELVRCIAAPIRDHTGHVIAAVSVSIVCAELFPQDRDSIVSEVLKTAADISNELGYDAKRFI